MKKVFGLLLIAAISSVSAFAKKKKINVTTDEGARLFVNGKEVGNSTTVVITNDGVVTYVRAEKVGHLPAIRQYSFVKSKAELPDNDYLQMIPDEAYTNSSTTNQANRDIDLRTELSEDEAWKLISRIVTNYFDVIEVTDKTTGYLRTAWVTKRFNGGSVRTRLIVKTGSNSPLSYKVKLSSEYTTSQSANDEDFKTWDRVLRTYEGVISEMQSRLGK
jgi:hypothetical protein